LLPYVSYFSKKFNNISKKVDAKLAFINYNKLSRFIKVQKDVLSMDLKKNILYKIF